MKLKKDLLLGIPEIQNIVTENWCWFEIAGSTTIRRYFVELVENITMKVMKYNVPRMGMRDIMYYKVSAVLYFYEIIFLCQDNCPYRLMKYDAKEFLI